jgi:hypothetical protein
MPDQSPALETLHVRQEGAVLHYLDPEEFDSGRDWVNFTFEYRF